MSPLSPSDIKVADTVRKVIIDLFLYVKNNNIDIFQFAPLIFNDEVRQLFASNPEFLEPLLLDIVTKFAPAQLAHLINPMLSSVLRSPKPSGPIDPFKTF